MRIAHFLLLVFCVQLTYPAFFVGNGRAGEKIPVLCESQEQIFVSSPLGSAEKMPLDTSFQAFFVPDSAGPYAVQCGNETKVVSVIAAQPPSAGQAEGSVSQGDSLLVFSIVALLLLFAAATALIAKGMVFSRATFVKTVEGRKARLELRAGKRLENVSIEDSVSMGFAGKPFRFSLPLVAPGTAWSYEYDIGDPERALSASLAAGMEGKRIALVSELFISGKKESAKAGGKIPAGKARRKLQRA